jgi:hypothetical protein
VLVGAPDALGPQEIDALREYARRRGGAVVLLPDRRPAGAYMSLVPVKRFEERLLERPIDLRARAGLLRASELAVTRDAAPATARASTEPPEALGIVNEWPMGQGRVILSGALDAWRFRAAGDRGFARFWEGTVAEVALMSPPKLQVTTSPAIARPGEEVRIRVALRHSEFQPGSDVIEVPPVRARIVSADGDEQMIRMWPAGEVGAFEGRLRAPAEGRYDVRVSSGTASADDVLLTATDVGRPRPAEDARSDRARAIASATGGIAVSSSDTAALERWLGALPRSKVTKTVRPARSMWFVIAFAAVLCAEWALRRRRGLW